MKRIGFLLAILMILVSACVPQAAATPAQKEPAGITVTDSLGRQVVLPEPPTRIVITGRALFMIIDAVYMFPNVAERIAAMGDAGQGTGNFIAMVDPNYKAKMTLQQDASAEQIAAVQPDLVILKSYLAETVGKPLEVLKIPVVYVDFETPEQYQRDIAILGKVLQNEARAKQLAAYYQSKVAEIQAAVKGASSTPHVLMLYYSDKDGAVAFNVPPMSWIQTRMVELAGGEPAWNSANPGSGWTKVSLEQIAAWDADRIFIITYNKSPSGVTAELKANPQWQALRAVKAGHLYAFAGDVFSWDQADTRWILGLAWLATRLHPEQTAKVDIVQQAKQFYETVYGLDSAFFEKNIRPTFRGDLP